MRIGVATSTAEVEALRPLWQEAFAKSPGTLFQVFDWNLLALRTFADESPCFVIAESQSSIAIIPWVRRDGVLTLAGGPLFDYHDAVRAGDSSAFEVALDATATLGLPLDIRGIRGKNVAHWSRLSPYLWTVAPFVCAKETPSEAFAREHSRARRALHRVTELGASVRRVTATAKTIEQIYREKAKETLTEAENVFRNERCIQFMRAAIGLPSTRCEVFLLEASDRSIAGLVTFIDGNVRRFYTTWMDAAWKKQSPGIALLFEATRQSLEEGLDCDYMTGKQAYKLRFAVNSEPLYKIEVSAELLSQLSHRNAELQLKAA